MKISECSSERERNLLATHQVGFARLGCVEEEDDDLVTFSRLFELVFVGKRLDGGAVEVEI